MATTKTVKRASVATKKTSTKTPAKAAKSPKSLTSSLSVSSLQKKALDPRNRRSLILAIVVILLVLGLYLGKSLVVAALVNGQPVSRLAIIQELEKQSGKAVLDSVITRMLVFQEANKKNITASEKDIDQEIAKIRAQFQAQGQNLDQLLTTQGLSKEKFRDEVKVQILVTKILGDQVKVSDKEFNDFLSKNQDLIASEKDQNVAKASLKQQMEQQKLAQKYQEWITTVRKNAKITTFVNY